MQQRVPNFASLPTERQKQLKQDLIAALVDDRLFKQFLKTSAPPVSEKEIDQQLSKLESTLAARKRSLADYCKDTNQSSEQLRSNLIFMKQWTNYANKKITDAEVKNYYLENKAAFDKATVRASHIVIRVSPLAQPAERDAAMQKLVQLKHEIAAGQITFADAAAKYSQCPTGSRGGSRIHPAEMDGGRIVRQSRLRTRSRRRQRCRLERYRLSFDPHHGQESRRPVVLRRSAR